MMGDHQYFDFAKMYEGEEEAYRWAKENGHSVVDGQLIREGNFEVDTDRYNQLCFNERVCNFGFRNAYYHYSNYDLAKLTRVSNQVVKDQFEYFDKVDLYGEKIANEWAYEKGYTVNDDGRLDDSKFKGLNKKERDQITFNEMKNRSEAYNWATERGYVIYKRELILKSEYQSTMNKRKNRLIKNLNEVKKLNNKDVLDEWVKANSKELKEFNINVNNINTAVFSSSANSFLKNLLIAIYSENKKSN